MIAKRSKPDASNLTPSQDDARKIIMNYRIMLKKTEEEHKKTIQDAHDQLNLLIADTDSAVQGQIDEVVDQSQPATPQSVWIKGSDNEDFLLCNKPAVDQINRLFAGFQEVIDELQKEIRRNNT